MRIAFHDDNDLDFTLVIKDESKKDKVIECMEKGIDAWYGATDPEHYKGDAFTKEEVEGFYWEGYAEPTEILLKREGIEFELVEDEYNEDGERIADVIVCY